MSSTAGVVNFPVHTLGDRWPGFQIGPVLVNGVSPAATLTRVRMHLVNGAERYRIDTDDTLRDAPATITNASTWTVTIPAIESGFLATSGVWEFDIEFYGGILGPETLLRGAIRVAEDVTK